MPRPKFEDVVERQRGEPLKDIIRRAQGRRTIRDLAHELGCGEQTLRAACKEYKVKIGYAPLLDE